MPLLRARRVSAATLMRGAVVQGGSLVWRDALLIGAVALALAAFTIFTADSRRIAGWFVLGAIGAFIAFPLLARLLMMAAARAGKPKLAGLRLALANLHRPGAPTPIVMLSLGLGLTVLVATALIEGNLREQITQAHPERCAGLLLRRHPVDPDAGLREGARRHPRRGAARQGAVAARPHHQDRRQAGERDRRPVGCALGDRRRPRRDLFGDAARGLAHRRRRMVAGRLSRAAAHLLRRGAGQGVRAGARRHHHGERAGPRHRGQDRLPAAHRMDDARHQLRLRLFARPARTRRRTPSSPR